MKFKKKLDTYSIKSKLLILWFVGILVSNCVEPFDFETEDFESILVVNSTVTNEIKHQQVLLSRTFRFEENGPILEEGANIKIIEESTATEYLFEETSPGRYLSLQEFGAISDKEYRLIIRTRDGRSYISDRTILPQETTINNLYPEIVSNNSSIEGIGIFVDTFDPTGNSKFYRYEYEEVYRITPPFFSIFDLTGNRTPNGEIEFDFVLLPESQGTCFATNKSNEIIVTNTTAFDEDRLTRFQLNFIPATDIRIEDRYSILVRQFVQSRDANGFYETLNNFSDSESLFSQVQSGFVSGNMILENNEEEKVLGYFNIASVSEKRIFFNRDDIMDALPKFDYKCELVVVDKAEEGDAFRANVLGLIESSAFNYAGGDPDAIVPPVEVFFVSPLICGDCRSLGSNEVPDFWID